LVIGLIAGCGGGDGGSSGVDPDKTLDQVTVDEAMDICEAAQNQISEEDAKIVLCYFTGILFGGENCEMVAQDCIADPDSVEEEECDVTVDNLPECASQVTVGELEACQAAQARQISELADTVSCESDPNFDTPAACAAVEEKCPELFEDPE
jgi:hypothetical protein